MEVEDDGSRLGIGFGGFRGLLEGSGGDPWTSKNTIFSISLKFYIEV